MGDRDEDHYIQVSILQIRADRDILAAARTVNRSLALFRHQL